MEQRSGFPDARMEDYPEKHGNVGTVSFLFPFTPGFWFPLLYIKVWSHCCSPSGSATTDLCSVYKEQQHHLNREEYR